MNHVIEFLPSRASPPGETIRELLRRNGIEPHALCSDEVVSLGYVDDLLNGAVPVTSAVARRLAEVLGPSEVFWIRREAQYRDDVARLQVEAQNWVQSLPVADMISLGWIEKSQTHERLVQALSFFGAESVDDWRERWLREGIGATQFRSSPTFSSDLGAVSAWLRQGEIAAEKFELAQWSREAFVELLPRLKPLTRLRDANVFLRQLQKMCAACGVAVVVIRTPKGCPISGAVRKVDGRAVIQLSFRYLTDDHFWFTFFHEAAHLVLHERTYLESTEDSETPEKEERQANDFAADFLVPLEYLNELRNLGTDFKAVMRFARKLSISPGIVVGQLQHRGLLDRRRLNFLKKRFSWATVSL